MSDRGRCNESPDPSRQNIQTNSSFVAGNGAQHSGHRSNYQAQPSTQSIANTLMENTFLYRSRTTAAAGSSNTGLRSVNPFNLEQPSVVNSSQQFEEYRRHQERLAAQQRTRGITSSLASNTVRSRSPGVNNSGQMEYQQHMARLSAQRTRRMAPSQSGTVRPRSPGFREDERNTRRRRITPRVAEAAYTRNPARQALRNPTPSALDGIFIPNDDEIREMRQFLAMPMQTLSNLRLYELQARNARNIVMLRNALLKLPPDSDTFRVTVPATDGDIFNETDNDVDMDENLVMAAESSSEASQPSAEDIVTELIAEIVDNVINGTPVQRLHAAALSRSERILAVDMEVLLAGITICSVDSLDRGVAPENTIFPSLEGFWLNSFLSTNADIMEAEATYCTDATQYGTHFKCLLHLEVHFTVQSALGELFPRYNNPNLSIWDEVNIRKASFLKVDVEKVSPSSCLIGFHGTTTDPKLTVGYLKEIRGATVCLGFFERGGRCASNLMLFVLHSISYDSDDVDIMTMEKRIDIASVKLCGNRSLLASVKPRRKDVIKLLPLESITSHLRMFRAAHHIGQAPRGLRNILYGDVIPQWSPDGNPVLLARGRDTIGSGSDQAKLREGVDVGCLNYLDSLTDRQCNDTQKNAILMCLKEMRSLSYETSSMSAIVGPPGTGKTTCIGLLVGTLLHHAEAGHILPGAEEINLLQKKDGFLRALNGSKAVKILICASSNAACDNIARKLLKGLPDGKGGLIKVNMVRVGCQGHDYSDLVSVSLREKALAFDNELFHPDVEQSHPSTKAVKAMAAECIVVLSTSSTSGSCTIRDLKVQFDVVVVEESGHSFEPECIIPIVTASGLSKTRRVHVVLVGDHKQLPPVIKSEHAVGRFLSLNKSFRYSKSFATQTWSLFERAVERARCPVAWLCRQYRTHPAISTIQSRQMYRNIVLQPPSESPYLARYNLPHLGGYYPFTFVDTSKLRSRLEHYRGDGKYENATEAALVERTLRKLLDLCEEGELDNQIIVTSPYRSQVDFLKEYLQDRFHVLANSVRRKKLNILIDTVDALMGLERKVVIVSLTRSNPYRASGFLDSRRRINVATSRAQNLLILIGDSTTVCHKVPMLEAFWSACFRKERGANIIFVEPQHPRDRQPGRSRQLDRMRQGVIRYRQDHGLRPRR